MLRSAVMMRGSICAIAFAVVSSSAACESGEDVVDEFRTQAQAKLELMRKSTKAALEEPMKDPPELPEKLRFEGEKANAYLVHPEWLQDPPKPPERSILVPATDFIAVRDVLRGSQAPSGVPEYYRKIFTGFQNVRWLVVIDSGSFSGGVMTGESTFSGGGWHGTLHFVDIEKGASIGTLSVQSSHSNTVDAIKGNESAHLSSDVWMHARAGINDALAPYRAPDQKPL